MAAAVPAAAAAASKILRTHLVFGANTDVGKTVVTAGLVRSRLAAAAATANSPSSSSPQKHRDAVHYIKPLQCGGSDEAWVRRHVELPVLSSSSSSLSSFQKGVSYSARTLYRWEMAASPHLASRVERMPVSDDEVIATLSTALSSLVEDNANVGDVKPSILVETAGGVLSPSSAVAEEHLASTFKGSLLGSSLSRQQQNILPRHSRDSSSTASHGSNTDDDSLSWGWSTQADLYQNLGIPAILVGDGRLGGISCTLSALESLQIRGYDVQGIVVVDDGGGYGNVAALREYASRSTAGAGAGGGSGERQRNSFENDPNESILSLPPLPPEPEPLDGWYQSHEVEEKLEAFETRLEMLWREEEEY
eukprot:CAMPEP_0178731820 /NCGR_PEP_ID=MMETSP0699-20121125/30238_1 /TAXON_ID=265572 /ORGANISM="Extubocellulus spinifer, Strain CCMP396" /LENGTH=363 /DNA_ID=CAMNT_0020383901 /DNA_START=654 /DNA_END=1744 /DNA_ORIENTATION=+